MNSAGRDQGDKPRMNFLTVGRGGGIGGIGGTSGGISPLR